MKAKWIVTIGAGAAIAMVPPADLSAQGRSGSAQAKQETRERADERDRRRDSRVDGRQYEDGRYAERRRGDRRAGDRQRVQQRQKQRAGQPAFCRSGAGHPVHGRQWCVDKGFGLGNGSWSRDLGDIILRRPRDTRRNESLGTSVLGDILGSVVLGRFESLGRQHASGPMTGRWLDDGGATVLQLMMGTTPIARLVDSDRDGRIDNVLLRR